MPAPAGHHTHRIKNDPSAKAAEPAPLQLTPGERLPRAYRARAACPGGSARAKGVARPAPAGARKESSGTGAAGQACGGARKAGTA
jgi:hypothetical protein